MPEVSDQDGSKHNQAIDIWKTLKPITLYEIRKNSAQSVDFKNTDSEFLDYDSPDFSTHGLFKKDSDCEEGIARVVYKKKSLIKEGQFAYGKLNGYGRVCYGDKSGCAHYTGMFKDDMFHGAGKLVRVDGTVQKGIFKDNVF